MMKFILKFILKRGIFYDEDFFSSLWEGYTDRFAR